MNEALFGQQSPDQGDRAVALIVGQWQVVVVHPPSDGPSIGICLRSGVSLPAPKEIFKPKSA